MIRARTALWFCSFVLALASSFVFADELQWSDVVTKARGQTVNFNAWAGDEKTNAFIAWVGSEVGRRYGITLRQVKLRDTAEAVTRVVAEKAAGRNAGGTVDLIWLNGPNFLALKEHRLLYGAFSAMLPNYRFVDTMHIRSNVVDFTISVDGFASPWRRAQIVFVYDGGRISDVPHSMRRLLVWAKQHPGRTTHPSVRNFLGATFLKQALYELAPDAAQLQQPATDASFAALTAPLWIWYDQLRPLLWRHGEQFPDNGPAQRQLLNDGEIDLMISFNPAEAAVAQSAGQLPASVRTVVFDGGTIGNTSFVAIPYNAAHKEAAMVAANFLLEPSTQARAQDYREIGAFTVLDVGALSAESRALFDALPRHPALPTNADLGTPLPEPHPSWMTRIAAQWERRYTK
jgi:putative thiamine transport system substrate-binding protein